MAGTAAGDYGDVGARGGRLGLGLLRGGSGGRSEGGRMAVDYFMVRVEEEGRVCEGERFEGGEHGGGGIMEEMFGCCILGN